MADKVADQKEVEVEKIIEKEEKKVVEPAKEKEEKSENGKAETETANGDVDEKENGAKEEVTEEEDGDVKTCSAKRKSAAGDVPDGTPAEGVSPEKKAKLEEATAEAESNGEPEVAA